jgi:hypothetical protein
MVCARRFAIPVLAALIPALLTGCGSRVCDDPVVERQERQELAQFHEMYTFYIKRNEAPPQRSDDLLQKEDPVHMAGLRVVKGEDYVVVWGLDVKKDAGAVLAYRKDALQQGGMVLIADGSIRNMSASELQTSARPGQ